MASHSIQTIMRPADTITVDEAEYQDLLRRGLIYSGNPVSPASDTEDLLIADKVQNGTATPAALRTALDAAYRQPLVWDVWAMGDSITDNGNAGGMAGTAGRQAGMVNFAPQSYMGWALPQTQGRWKFGGVAATFGYTSAQILATHLPTVLAAKPAACVVLAGTNDLPATPLATTIANLTSIYAQLQAAGIKPILATLPPNVSHLTDTAVLARNLWIRKYARDNGLPCVDFFAGLVDPATGGYQTAYTQDGGVHPSGAGARVMGNALAAVLNAIPGSAPSPLMASSNPNALLGNACMTADANSDGRPDSWSVLASFGTSTFASVVDAAVIGKKYTMTRGDTDYLTNSANFTLVAGHRMLFALKMAPSAVPAGGTWSLILNNVAGSGVLTGYTNMTDTIPMGTPIFEFVVPSGLSSYVFRVEAWVKAVSGVTMEIGQVTVLDLTALGVA